MKNRITEAITVEDARRLAKEGKLTLRQLRQIVPNTNGVSTPTRDWIRENVNGDEVFITEKRKTGDSLTVFFNGFFVYTSMGYYTVLRVDGFKELRFETNEYGGYSTIPEREFLDTPFDYPLCEYGMWQLKTNAEKRLSKLNESAVDSEIMEANASETPDILDEIISKEEEAEKHERLINALSLLTDKQMEVIKMTFLENMSRDEIAENLGISRDSVKDRLNGALKKLKKYF